MLDKLPPEYDSRVKAMEVCSSSWGGLGLGFRSGHGWDEWHENRHEGMGRIESGYFLLKMGDFSNVMLVFTGGLILSKVRQVRAVYSNLFFPHVLQKKPARFFCLCVTPRTSREFDAKVKMLNVVSEFKFKCHCDVNSWYICLRMILMLTHGM